MDGILLIDKPVGFTSFDVVAKLRGIIKQKKIGHTGTLDPMATGVLVCLLGKSTRLCELLPRDDKSYRAQLQLGMTTTTQDATGEIISQQESHVTLSQLTAALPLFRGGLSQLPPMYSAVSVGGKRLYDLARQGIEVERRLRDITIYSLELLDFDEINQRASLDIHCSKGTYIRTLAHDLGQALGVGATLTALRRTMAAGFPLEDCLTFSEVETLTQEDLLESRLVKAQNAFALLPQLHTGEWQRGMLNNGVPLMLDKLNNPETGRYTLWCNGEFLGMGCANTETDSIRMLYKE